VAAAPRPSGTSARMASAAGALRRAGAVGYPAAVPPLRLNSDVPADLERIITKCLEKDRNLRYQHASEIRTDLQRLKRDTESKRVAVGGTTPAGFLSDAGVQSEGGLARHELAPSRCLI
jgi:hypothetical protein